MSEDASTIDGSKGSECCSFETAASAADGGAGAGTGAAPSFASQISNVQDWSRSSGVCIAQAEVDSLTLVSESTSEHKVYYRQSDLRAVKVTLAGFYGQIPVIIDGRLERRNATPAEYLRRMALHNAIFESDLRLEGVLISDKPSMILFSPPGEPSFVISQPWYIQGGEATNEMIHDFLAAEEFISVPGTYFGFYRPADRVAIVDAKPDNFILTEVGLVALDLQIAVFGEEEVAGSTLPASDTLCRILIPREVFRKHLA